MSCQVDLILEQLGVFWANTEVVLELLTKKGQHVEHFIGFANKPRLMQRSYILSFQHSCTHIHTYTHTHTIRNTDFWSAWRSTSDSGKTLASCAATIWWACRAPPLRRAGLEALWTGPLCTDKFLSTTPTVLVIRHALIPAEPLFYQFYYALLTCANIHMIAPYYTLQHWYHLPTHVMIFVFACHERKWGWGRPKSL